ncbi:hypothetical protein ACWPKO_15720 [Coraliomargarita sp. W4R53]
MNKNLLLTLYTVSTIGASLSQTSASTIAYFGDGGAADSAALVNLVPTNPDLTITSLFISGFEDNNLTRNEFGNSGSTPAGSTAGSAVGSEWFFIRGTSMTNSPSTVDDYFGFTVTANGSDTLDLNTLKYDLVSVASSNFINDPNDDDPFTATAEAFLSVDGGTSFASIGSISATSAVAGSGFGVVESANFDLSGYSGASSIEIRIVLSDDILDSVSAGNQSAIASFVQGIQLDATAIPEPGSYALIYGLSAMAVLLNRRRSR